MCGRSLALATALLAVLTSAAWASGAGESSQGAAAGQRAADTGATAYVCTADLLVALGATSRDLETRRTEVRRREGELRLAVLGLSAMASMTAEADLGANLLREADPSWATGLQLDAGLSYRHDAVAIARARANLVTAERRAATQKRSDVLSALLSLSRLRAAQRASANTDSSAAEAESLLNSVRESAADAFGDWTEADADVLLNIRELDLAAARARATASGRADEAGEAQAELSRLGVAAAASRLLATSPGGPAECLTAQAGPAFRTADLGLPQPVVGSSAERALLELAVRLATALHERAALAPLRELSMTAHYQEGGARILAEVDLAAGRPSAGLNFRVRDSNASNWGIGVSATIRIDDSMGDALAASRAQLAEAERALQEFDAAFPDSVRREAASVQASWLTLAFAVEALSIARARHELAVEQRDADRAAQTVTRAVDTLEREYQAYLRALARYLAAFDLEWGSLAGD